MDQRPMVLFVNGDGDATSCVAWINRRGKTRAYHKHDLSTTARHVATQNTDRGCNMTKTIITSVH